jgi:hypothetical protein
MADPRPRGLHFLPFPLKSRVSAATQCIKTTVVPPSLGLSLPRQRMRTKSLVTFRSKCTGFEESKMEKVAILDPSTVWETSTVTKEQIQSLVDRGLLRPKEQVGWRPTSGVEFPTEGTSETVDFLAHIERGFGVPLGDFLRGLLHFYRIELLHLAPNSIMIISTFVHLCEAYLGIAPHFHL